MIILGVILLICGVVIGFGVLTILGIALILIGLVLALAFRAPYAGGGTAPWYHRRWY